MNNKTYHTMPEAHYDLCDKNEIRVFSALCSFMYGDRIECFPSVRSIANKCKVCVRTVQTYLKSMEKKGIISIERIQNRTNKYTLLEVQKITSRGAKIAQVGVQKLHTNQISRIKQVEIKEREEKKNMVNDDDIIALWERVSNKKITEAQAMKARNTIMNNLKFSLESIKKAILNYDKVLNNNEYHWTATYKSLNNFIKSGIDDYFHEDFFDANEYIKAKYKKKYKPRAGTKEYYKAFEEK